ncbi:MULTISPECIES: NAD(P)-dependent oxidoreductase [Mesorhizobium]|uniref:NAD(P)-dependent oxidoreductase n=1 Tax=Mesorhizobium sp. LNHC232B00 TaxID=1287243 RepID=UPI0003CE93C7|nr:MULTISPECIES: NAD(P)-dependent oxidoreductase [Mesorhizobium]ESY64073.1 6-phosphogluconate dehydrogenase [Mesorhizobium sp. LNHC232B00]
MSEAEPIAFIGLGMMGLPMASRLVASGFDVRGADLSEASRAAFAAAGGRAVETASEAVSGASMVVTMLPNAAIVADVLVGSGGAAASLPPGALVVDMSSSAPFKTRELGDKLAKRGVGLIDAPVSGGVSRAKEGTLAIMAGGDSAAIERARPVLSAMGKSIFVTGLLGSGHAMKALNNYVSASGLVAACEALMVGRAFGLDAETIVDVLNVSTGRNNSTETKLKPFVVSESFASGFAIGLMAKDIRTAADLADELGLPASEMSQSAALWEQAAQMLGKGADHTEIYRYLASPRQ